MLELLFFFSDLFDFLQGGEINPLELAPGKLGTLLRYSFFVSEPFALGLNPVAVRPLFGSRDFQRRPDLELSRT